MLAAIAFSLALAVPPEASAYRREYVRLVRAEWGLNVPIASLAGQIHQESGWNCRAVSRVGARSCAQFMPTTANWINEEAPRLRSDEMYSPAWSFRAQAVYMKYLVARVVGGNPCEAMAFGLSAYNGGLGRVYARQKLSRDPGRCLGATCEINPGITEANQRENAGYPKRILATLEPIYGGALWGKGSCSGIS